MLQASRSAETIGVVISAHSVSCGVLRGQGYLEGSVTTQSVNRSALDRDVQLAQVLVSLAAALSPHLQSTKRVVRVCISDHWLAVACLPWSPSLLRVDQARGYARQQLMAAGFQLDAGDSIAIDDGPYGEPRLAVAYSVSIMAALNGFAAAIDASIAAVLPLSALSWRLAGLGAGAGAVLAVLEDESVLLIHGRRRLSAVVARRLVCDGTGGDNRAAALQELWQRQCLRYPSWSEVSAVKWLDLSARSWRQGAMPSPWDGVALGIARPEGLSCRAMSLLAVVQMDDAALNVVPRTGLVWGWWGALGALLLSALVIGMQGQAALRSRQATAAQADSGRSAPVVAPVAQALSITETKRLKSVNAAIAGLNIPVSKLLQALQPPKDIEVGILSLDISAAEMPYSAKIVAESSSGDDMVRYVDFLASSAPYIRVQLRRHEWLASDTGRRYRFALEASWAP